MVVAVVVEVDYVVEVECKTVVVAAVEAVVDAEAVDNIVVVVAVSCIHLIVDHSWIAGEVEGLKVGRIAVQDELVAAAYLSSLRTIPCLHCEYLVQDNVAIDNVISYERRSASPCLETERLSPDSVNIHI